jgi:gluconate 2-dehydrogenase alpha chain
VSGVDPAADVVIVGVGAAGGVAAQVLAEAGLEVVGLEAGERLTEADYRFDEVHNDIRNWMSEPKAKHELPTWRLNRDSPAVACPWPSLMANAVGGSSIHYECVSFRFLPWTFRAHSHTVERYGPAAIPTGSTLADWPIGYDDLEPFYELAEYAIGVSGHAGRVAGDLDPAGNAFEASRASHYPMTPLRRTGWSELMASAGAQLGWHPFPAPAAINSDGYDGRPGCTYCGFCQSNGCHVNAKGSTAATVIPRAEATGRFRVVTSARAVGIDVNADGSARAVRYVRDGVERVQPASAVLLAGFTYENVRLLLVSKSPAFPDGLANRTGQVGRHFIAHVTPFAFGTFPDRRLNMFNGTIAQATSLDDWNGDNFDHAEMDFIGGGVLTTGGELKPIAVAAGLPPPGVPRWGGSWKSWLARHAQSVGAAFGQFEALPYEANFLDLDPVVCDPLGMPVIRVTHDVHENERAGAAFLGARMCEWLRAAGAAETWLAPGPPVEGRHVYGGTRMGTDPGTSVVDGFGFAHEAPNVGILGASTFPTAGGYNPTLTVQALAWRTASHLVDQWGTIASAD